MWPKEIFDLKRSDDSEEKLKQIIAEKNAQYLQDYLKEFEVAVDKRPESV